MFSLRWTWGSEGLTRAGRKSGGAAETMRLASALALLLLALGALVGCGEKTIYEHGPMSPQAIAYMDTAVPLLREAQTSAGLHWDMLRRSPPDDGMAEEFKREFVQHWSAFEQLGEMPVVTEADRSIADVFMQWTDSLRGYMTTGKGYETMVQDWVNAVGAFDLMRGVLGLTRSDRHPR